MGRLTAGRLLMVAAAAPGIALVLARLAVLVLGALGAHPFWHWESLTLSEAAALRDGGEVAHLLSRGHDPNAVYDIRRGFLFSEAVALTPVQAATAAGRPEIVQLLVDAGARADVVEK
jgi:hypothetical protein